MNRKSDSENEPFDIRDSKGKLDWKKILLVLVVVGIVGYNWYSENVANPNAAEGTAVLEEGPNETRSNPLETVDRTAEPESQADNSSQGFFQFRRPQKSRTPT